MRRAIVIVTAVVGLILILAAIGPRLIPSSTYQGIIEESLKAQLKARVEIDRFKFRLIPYPGYTIEGFRLISDAPPFQGMTLLQAEKITGSLAFPALLRGKIVTGVDVRGAEINIKFSQGVSNIGTMLKIEQPGDVQYDQTIKSMAAPAEPSQAPAASPPDSSPGSSPPGSGPEIRSMPAPSIEEPGPSSWNIFPAIVGPAYAEEAGGDGIETGSLKIEKIDMIRGRITIDADSLPQQISITDASLSVKKIRSGATPGANVRLSGVTGNSARPNLSIGGSISMDRARRELTVKRLAAYFNGSQFAGDLVLSYGFTPASMDIHVASPNLAPAAADAALAYLGRGLPPTVSWKGTAAFDAKYKGTASAGEVELSLDARNAEVAVGQAFKKEQGSPFKASVAGVLSDAALSIASGSVTVASSEFSIAGEARRDAGITSSLNLSGALLGEEALRLFLPGMQGMVDLGEFGADIKIAGEIASPAPMTIAGRIEAAKASAAGIAVENMECSFERQAEAISIASIKGAFASGNFSGTGKVVTSGTPSMEFEVVAHDLDSAAVRSLGGAILGKIELAAKVVTSGVDRYSMTDNLVMSGTLVAQKFSGPIVDAARGLLTEELTKQISVSSGLRIDGAALLKASVASEEGLELKAGFEISKGLVSAQNASWNGEGYSARGSAAVDSTSSLKGEGEIVLAADVAKKMVPDPAASKALLEKDGTFVIPVEIGGRLAKPEFQLLEKKFTERMQTGERLRAQEQAALEAKKKEEAEAAKAEKAEKAEKAKAKAEKSAQAVEKSASPKPAPVKPQKRPSTTAPIEDVDDILKVIVGE